MCFSASASFIAGTTLCALGFATLHRARDHAEVPFAVIPLLFGLQQIVEGLLWLSFQFDAPGLNLVMTYLFSMFSHVLWPIYVPFAIGLLETVAWRRRVLWGFQGAGLLAGLYLLWQLLDYPVTAVVAEHIVYVSPHFHKVPVMLLYLAATCVSCLFSSKPTIRLFGALALLFFGVSYALFNLALFSVWCFFAAILSAMIYWYFRFGREVRHAS